MYGEDVYICVHVGCRTRMYRKCGCMENVLDGAQKD